jgi:hypothetical protein
VAGDSQSHIGVSGFSASNAGVVGASASNFGVYGENENGAAGVQGVNIAGGYGVFGYATGTSGQGVWGESVATGIAHGIGADGVHGMTHTTNGAGVSGGNDALGGVGVYGYSTNSGFGFATNSNVQQARGMGGWAKAMALVDPFAPGGIAVTQCYNSQATGAAVYTPPCGITITSHTLGNNALNFGFQVNDRYLSATSSFALDVIGANAGSPDANSISTETWDVINASYVDVAFYLIVY